MKKTFLQFIIVISLTVFCNVGQLHAISLGDLNIPASRVPNWNPGVEGGIPDTSTWNVIEANDAPYNIVANAATEVGTTLQNALNAAEAAGVPTVVHLDAGTYVLGYGKHLVLASNVVLKGDGPDETRITYYVQNGGSYARRDTVIIGSDYAINDYTMATPTALASNAAIGASSVTTTGAHGLTVGDWIIVGETGKDPAMFQSLGTNASDELISHIAKVTVINGLTVTFDRPLRIAMHTAYASQIRKLVMTENAGVQDLALVGDSRNETQGALVFNYAANSWVYNVEITQPRNRFISITYAARNTVEKVTCTGPSTTTEGTNNYGIQGMEGAHDNLITNNIFKLLYTVLLFQEGASGNVASYNYVATSRNDDTGVSEFDMEVHGQYAHENLFEGNDLLYGARHDTYWGSNGPRNFWFRNRMNHGSGNDLKNGADGWYYSVDRDNAPEDQTTFILNMVNVIGLKAWYVDTQKTPTENWDGNEPAASTDNLSYDNTNMWFERNGVSDTSGVTGIHVDPTPTTNENDDGDPQPNPNTTLTDNYFGNSAPGSWDSLDLPASLYLTAEPSFWGAKQWPGIGADVDVYEGNNAVLPAQDRYVGGDTTSPASPSGLSVL